MRTYIAVYVGVLFILFFPSQSAASPSFDCQQASTASELAICADLELAELDAEMARLYTQSRKTAATGVAENLIAQQRAWLKKRATCGADVSCLKFRFRERIAELKSEDAAANQASASMDCSQALSDVRNVSASIQFSFDHKEKVVPSTRIELAYSGARRSSIPLYIVIDLPTASRLFGNGFLSLTANARGPNGLEFAIDRARAIVPLNADAPASAGTIGVNILLAGAHEVGLSVVTGGQCGEQVIQSQRIPLRVELGLPELVVQDVSVGAQPQSVIFDSSGTLSLSIHEAHYDVLNRATGSLLFRRPGLKPRFSPTGRFVVSIRAVDKHLEVIDVLAGVVVGQFSPGVLAWARNDSFIVAGGTSRTGINVTMSSLNPDMKFETTMANQQAAWWDDEMVLDVDQVFFAATTIEGSAFWDLVSGERWLQTGSDPGAALRRVVMDRRGVNIPKTIPRWKLGEPIQITHDDWLVYGNAQSAAAQEFKLADGGGGFGSSHNPASAGMEDAHCGDSTSGRGLARIDNTGILCAHEIGGRGLLRLPEESITAPEEVIFDRITDHTGPLAGLELAEIGRYGGWWDNDTNSRARLDDLVTDLRRAVPQFDAGISLLRSEDMAGFGNCRTALREFDPRHIVRSWQWQAAKQKQVVVYLECHMGSGWQRFANLFLISEGSVRNLSPALMSDEEMRWASEDDMTAQSVFGQVEGDGSDVQVAAIDREHFLISSSFAGRAAIVHRRTGTRLGALLPTADATLVRAMRMTRDGRHLVQLNHDGRFFVVRTSDGEQVLLGAHVDDEIVVMAPDGRFDTSYEGAHSLHVRFPGLGVIQTVHQFRSALYRPGLAQAVLRGGEVADRPDTLGVPPIVEFSLGAAVNGMRLLTIQAADDSMVATARLMIDGKLVAEYPLQGASVRHVVEIKDPGGGRWVTVVATDRDGLASSPKAILLPSPVAKRGTLRTVIVGIDTYRGDPGIPPLRYARSDAQRLHAVLNVSGQSYNGQHEAKVLLDDDASRTAILAAVRKTVAEMNPDDTLVFSFAGHAVGSDKSGRSGRLLLALSDTRRENLEQTALSWGEVTAELLRARGKVLVLLDACHTGLAGGSGLATNDELASELMNTSGAPLIILAASKGRQVALEDGRKGGGIFTSALVDALSKERDRVDRDSNGAIDLGELYSNVKLKVLSETGGKQSPWLARNLLIGDMTLF
ncbi:caspase family protein [Rhizobium herbae]